MKDKPRPGIPSSVQAWYYLLIFVAGGFMVWEKSKPLDRQRLWFLLTWLVVMLYAFFKATRNWAYDNPKPSNEELLERERTKKQTPEIRDVDIPSLEEMTRKLKNHVEHE